MRTRINDPYNTMGSSPQSRSRSKKWHVQVINRETGNKHVMEVTAPSQDDAQRHAEKFLRDKGVPEKEITGKNIRTLRLPLD